MACAHSVVLSEGRASNSSIEVVDEHHAAPWRLFIRGQSQTQSSLNV